MGRLGSSTAVQDDPPRLIHVNHAAADDPQRVLPAEPWVPRLPVRVENAGDVSVALVQDHVAVMDEVADERRAAPNVNERVAGAILDQPVRPAHGCACVATAGLETARSGSPEPPDRRPDVKLRRAAARATR